MYDHNKGLKLYISSLHQGISIEFRKYQKTNATIIGQAAIQSKQAKIHIQLQSSRS